MTQKEAEMNEGNKESLLEENVNLLSSLNNNNINNPPPVANLFFQPNIGGSSDIFRISPSNLNLRRNTNSNGFMNPIGSISHFNQGGFNFMGNENNSEGINLNNEGNDPKPNKTNESFGIFNPIYPNQNFFGSSNEFKINYTDNKYSLLSLSAIGRDEFNEDNFLGGGIKNNFTLNSLYKMENGFLTPNNKNNLGGLNINNSSNRTVKKFKKTLSTIKNLTKEKFTLPEMENNTKKFKCEHTHCELFFKTFKQLLSHHQKMSPECKKDTLLIMRSIAKLKRILLKFPKRSIIIPTEIINKYEQIMKNLSLDDYALTITGINFYDKEIKEAGSE